MGRTASLLSLLCTGALLFNTDAQVSPASLLDMDGSLDYPANLTGTFIGNWFAPNISHSEADRPQFHDTGMLIMRLTSTEVPLNGNIHLVKGEALIRDKLTGNSRDDLRFVVEGVYSIETGRLGLFSNAPGYWWELPAATEILPPGFNSTWRNMTFEQYNGTMYSSYSSCELSWTFYSSPSDIDTSSALGVEGNDGLGRMIFDYPSDDTDMVLYGSALASGCNFDLQLMLEKLEYEVYFGKAEYYSTIVSGLTLIQMWAVFQQLKASLVQSRAIRMSVVTLAMHTLLDAYMSIFHLTSALAVEELFSTFLVTSLLQFALFSMLEMRLLLIVSKFQFPVLFEDGSEIGRLYLKFYIALFIGMFVVYTAKPLIPFILIAAYSFWIPQIYQSVIKDSRHTLLDSYTLILSVTRLFIPLCMDYTKTTMFLTPVLDFFGCPANFIGSPSNYALCYYLSMLLLLQVSFLYMQTLLGPRCFIPPSWLPERYTYRRPIARTDDPSCAICMTELWDPELGEIANPPTTLNVMVCPCDHAFHEECLLRWMEHKMECPSCRGPLSEP